MRRPVDVIGLAQALGYSIRFEDFEPTLSGCYVAKHRVIGVNKSHASTRQRFTVAHEIAHAILHADNDAALFLDEHAVHLRDSTMFPRATEIEANRFAAELLMPESEVRQLVSSPVEIYDEEAITAIARAFDVSPQAFTVRLFELDLVATPRSSAKNGTL